MRSSTIFGCVHFLEPSKPAAKKAPLLSAPPGLAPPPGMSAAVEAQWLYKDDNDKVRSEAASTTKYETISRALKAKRKVFAAF